MVMKDVMKVRIRTRNGEKVTNENEDTDQPGTEGSCIREPQFSRMSVYIDPTTRPVHGH